MGAKALDRGLVKNGENAAQCRLGEESLPDQFLDKLTLFLYWGYLQNWLRGEGELGRQLALSWALYWWRCGTWSGGPVWARGGVGATFRRCLSPLMGQWLGEWGQGEGELGRQSALGYARYWWSCATMGGGAVWSGHWEKLFLGLKCIFLAGFWSHSIKRGLVGLHKLIQHLL